MYKKMDFSCRRHELCSNCATIQDMNSSFSRFLAASMGREVGRVSYKMCNVMENKMHGRRDTHRAVRREEEKTKCEERKNTHTER